MLMLMLKLRKFPIIVITHCKSTRKSLQTLPKHSLALLHNINLYILHYSKQQQPATVAAAKLHYSLTTLLDEFFYPYYITHLPAWRHAWRSFNSTEPSLEKLIQ